MAYVKMKAGTVFTANDGTRRVKTNERDSSLYWDYNMLYALRKYYPNTPTDEVAGMCGVSVRTLIRKANALGIKKDPKWLEERQNRGLRMMKFLNRSRPNLGTFKKGMAPTATSFKKGHIPVTRKPVIRLDTGEVYECARIASEVLGVTQSNVCAACRRRGKAAGVPVRWRKDVNLSDYGYGQEQ